MITVARIMTAIRAAIAYGKIVPPLSPVARGGFVGLAACVVVAIVVAFAFGCEFVAGAGWFAELVPTVMLMGWFSEDVTIDASSNM